MMANKLPKYIQTETTRHGRRVYYFRRGANKPRVRMPDDINSPAFAERYAALIQGFSISSNTENQRKYLERLIRQKAKHARIRDGHKRSVQSEITADWAVEKLREQKYRCAVTGIEFHVFPKKGARLQPFAPSLDRIDNSKGYLRNNVQIVILAYNMMRLDWSTDVVERVITAYRSRNISRTFDPIPDIEKFREQNQ